MAGETLCKSVFFDRLTMSMLAWSKRAADGLTTRLTTTLTGGGEAETRLAVGADPHFDLDTMVVVVSLHRPELDAVAHVNDMIHGDSVVATASAFPPSPGAHHSACMPPCRMAPPWCQQIASKAGRLRSQ